MRFNFYADVFHYLRQASILFAVVFMQHNNLVRLECESRLQRENRTKQLREPMEHSLFECTGNIAGRKVGD